MLSSRTKIKQAYFLVFSGKRHIQCKEERWFLSPTCPRIDVEQFLQPLASGTAQNSSQFSSAQAEEGEKTLKIRHVQSHSCRCQGAALSQTTPICVAGRRLTLQFFGSSTPFKKPLLTTSLLERSSLHTAFCCREGTCHSQQLSLSKPGFNYKSVN